MYILRAVTSVYVYIPAGIKMYKRPPFWILCHVNVYRWMWPVQLHVLLIFYPCWQVGEVLVVPAEFYRSESFILKCLFRFIVNFCQVLQLSHCFYSSYTVSMLCVYNMDFLQSYTVDLYGMKKLTLLESQLFYCFFLSRNVSYTCIVSNEIVRLV